MNDDITNRSPPRSQTGSQAGDEAGGDGNQTLSGREILLILGALALVCMGGYFFLFKMIDVSRGFDCAFGHYTCR